MKRRNAESGKMRRPMKKAKIPEGMVGNSMIYLKFVMLWALVVLMDHWLHFRFEFLWPIWMILKSVYDSFKYQGIMFSVFFLCIALTSDLVCYFFMPISWMFIAASTYVWVQCIWYTVADKGLCLPTVAMCCLVAYVESTVRTERSGGLVGGGFELARPLAAHCVGYPAVSLGFYVKSYVNKSRTSTTSPKHFYFNLLRDSGLTEHGCEQTQEHRSSREERTQHLANGSVEHKHEEHKHMNGSTVRNRTRKAEANGLCSHSGEHLHLNTKVEKSSEKSSPNGHSKHATSNGHVTPCHVNNVTAMANGHVTVPGDGTAVVANVDVGHDQSKGSAKSTRSDRKEASVPNKEDRKRNKNRDKEREREIADSLKNIESKEHLVKEDCTKEPSKPHKEISHKERERDREREREIRLNKSCIEELARVKAELDEARAREMDARRELQALQEKALQNKSGGWRREERLALERRLSEERRARHHAERMLHHAHDNNKNGECSNESCKSKHVVAEAESGALRREVSRSRERLARLQRDLNYANQQLRTLEASRREQQSSSPNDNLAVHCASLQERTCHLERSLSAETRVKLDLLSALGEAKRQCTIREDLISRQEKMIEELKAQMLAVMPSHYVSSINRSVAAANHTAHSVPQSVQSINHVLAMNRNSHLDPNASSYTPKQLISDA